MTVHSSRGPSGYHRWAVCLGSAEAEANVPDRTSKWAAQGTLFHLLIADMIEDRQTPASDFLGLRLTVDGYVCECDDEMVGHLAESAWFVDGMIGQKFVEKRVSLDPWLPGEWGTTDVGIVNDDLLTIVDWKYGSIPVTESEQLMLYALGFWAWLRQKNLVRENPIERVRLIVRQPRVEGGGIEWNLSIGELLEFGEEAHKKHEQSKQAGNPRTPGTKQCRWCRAKRNCKEYNDFASALASTDVDIFNPNLPAVINRSSISPERRSFILINWPLVEKWHDQLHEEAMADALAGRPVPHMKLIAGRRGKRTWRDEDKAKEELLPLLQDRAIITTVISPPEAEKRLEKREYEKLKGNIEQTPGKPVLVGEKEPGTPIKSVDSQFEELANG